MARVLVAKQVLIGEDGREHFISYYRLESARGYGICIRDRSSGELEMAPYVTTQRAQVDALLRRMISGKVSPLTMRDVVVDWLAS